jgi:hypothetical protein
MSDVLKSFRRNAVHVRQALEVFEKDAGRVEVEGGYLQDAGLIERYKRLSIPVRRALNPTDRASFAQSLQGLAETAGVDKAELGSIRAAWDKLQQELDSLVGLGGSKVPRRQILMAWLEAAAFYDKLDRDRAYDQMINEWGKAAEGIGAQLMEDSARVILRLDEAAASALGEPVILPPPVKTPPPPPDPNEKWWRRLFGF